MPPSSRRTRGVDTAQIAQVGLRGVSSRDEGAADGRQSREGSKPIQRALTGSSSGPTCPANRGPSPPRRLPAQECASSDRGSGLVSRSAGRKASPEGTPLVGSASA